MYCMFSSSGGGLYHNMNDKEFLSWQWENNWMSHSIPFQKCLAIISPSLSFFGQATWCSCNRQKPSQSSEQVRWMNFSRILLKSLWHETKQAAFDNWVTPACPGLNFFEWHKPFLKHLTEEKNFNHILTFWSKRLHQNGTDNLSHTAPAVPRLLFTSISASLCENISDVHGQKVCALNSCFYHSSRWMNRLFGLVENYKQMISWNSVKLEHLFLLERLKPWIWPHY